MERNLNELQNGDFDLIIVGGGIHGLSAAWDAALRGLRVALLEQRDFGSETSANSYRIVHGGLRYLQHLNFVRMRMSIGERSHLMRMAPHLIQPLPFLVPCYGHGMKGPEALRAALTINDLVGADRNSPLDPANHIPRGYMMSAAQCLETFPGLCRDGLTGAAVFHDGQMYDSERLSLEFALSASEQGASIANYVRATGIRRLTDGTMVVRAHDGHGGADVELRGRFVLNTSGPWLAHVLAGLDGAPPRPASPVYSKGVQVITRKFMPDMGIALEGQQRDTTAKLARGNRSWFVTPWHGCSFIGTTDTRYEGEPETFQISGHDIDELLDAVNAAYPPAQLTRDDVRFWNGGLRPYEGSDGDNTASVSHETRIIDHAREHALEGIISISGVKYTTCRYVAEKAIDHICNRLGRPVRVSPTRTSVLAGAGFDSWTAFLQEQTASFSETPRRTRLYGSHIKRIRALAAEIPALAERVSEDSDMTRAEIVHTIRNESALTLDDVIMRRTGLAVTGAPPESTLLGIADQMALELQWPKAERELQLKTVRARFQLG